MCSLAAIVSVILSSAVLAGSAKEQQVSGTVVECDEIVLVIKDSKKEQLTFNPKFLGNQRYQPKVGDQVTVHWEVGRHPGVVGLQGRQDRQGLEEPLKAVTSGNGEGIAVCG